MGDASGRKVEIKKQWKAKKKRSSFILIIGTMDHIESKKPTPIQMQW